MTTLDAANGPIVVSGRISGGQTAYLSKDGAFDVVLAGANTYRGQTWLIAGNLEARTSTALGMRDLEAVGSGTVLYRGTSVTLGPGVVVEEVFLTAGNTLDVASIRVPTGAATLIGLILFTDHLAIGVEARATLDLQCPIDLGYGIATPANLFKRGAGPAILSNGTGSALPNNWFMLRVEAGLLRLGRSGAEHRDNDRQITDPVRTSRADDPDE